MIEFDDSADDPHELNFIRSPPDGADPSPSHQPMDKVTESSRLSANGLERGRPRAVWRPATGRAMKQRIVVVGGGTAGLIAAISLRRVVPDATVTVIRSRAMGHVMVGEGTFAATPNHLHEVLGIPRRDFCALVDPTWKLGVRFLWGPRPYFDYPFAEKFDNQILPRPGEPWGYYCLDDWPGISSVCRDALRDDDPPHANPAVSAGLPAATGYHIENHPFVEYLERHLEQQGGILVDAKVVAAVRGEQGIASLRLDSGQDVEAELFVDASGFSGLLIHQQLGEPWVSLRDHLFCDRAIVGGWERPEGERIAPYTTAETMEAGWCWRIEHQRVINRGYVYSSAHKGDDEAAAEMLRANPRLDESMLRAVPFESRYIRRAWVGNVVAMGNACGFVEPLEATNIQVICGHALRMAQVVAAGVDARAIEEFNRWVVGQWEEIRDFLALHYRFNTRLSTRFWEMATRETPLGNLQGYVDRYRAQGPSLWVDEATGTVGMFGHDSYLAMLLGMRVPWDRCEIQ